MRHFIQQQLSALIAGFAIGIAAIAYLTVGGIIGSVLFGFGLLAVISLKVNLFTGKAQCVWGANGSIWLILMLLFNLLGTYIVSLIFQCTHQSDITETIIQNRITLGWWKCGLLSIPCGFIMTAAVRAAKDNNWWVLLLGVPTFIICGFPHCIADSFYMWCSSMPREFVWQCYPSIVVGNYLGCNIYRLSKSNKNSKINSNGKTN